MKFENNTVLIERLKKGDEKAYMFLLDHYHRRLHVYALSLINDHALAEDIVQNVFLKTWQFRMKLNPKYTIQSFLYKSVYNEFINTYKKNQSMSQLHHKYYEYLNEIAEETDDNSLIRMMDIVNGEMEKLPSKCYQIFVLSKREGLTNREIAEHLKLSVKTVESQITKAFGILRDRLGDKYSNILFLLFRVPRVKPYS